MYLRTYNRTITFSQFHSDSNFRTVTTAQLPPRSYICLSVHADRRCNPSHRSDAIEGLLKQLPEPTHQWMDQGPASSFHALQQWWLTNGPGAKFVLPASAWQNPVVKVFNRRFMDTFLTIELFTTVQEAGL